MLLTCKIFLRKIVSYQYKQIKSVDVKFCRIWKHLEHLEKQVDTGKYRLKK